MSQERKNLLLSEAKRLRADMKRFYDSVYIAEDGWADVYDREDPNDQYIRSELYKAAELMRKSYNILDAMTSPVAAEGVLERNSNGRFSLVGRELTSGYGIEYLIKDDFDGIESWRPGSIEHYDGDYRIAGYPNIPLEGLRARVKA